MEAPTMNSNIIMLPFSSIENTCKFATFYELNQFSVKQSDVGGFILSTPVTEALEEAIPGILHGARGRAKAKDKPDPKPPTGGDNTPPSGGTPGSTSVWKQTYTEARAA